MLAELTMIDAPVEEDRNYLIRDLPADERPRERLLNYGSEGLSNTELLAIILRSGPRGKSTLDLARELLLYFDGDLNRMAGATPQEFSAIKGIGPAKAADLKATFTLAVRLASTAQKVRPKVGSPRAAADFMRETLRGKRQEELWTLLLDTKNTILSHQLITVGLVDRSQAHAREVFRAAIHHNAARVILVHNHPSGDPTPSSADISCTKELAAAGKVIGIEVVDHIVLGSRTDDRHKDFYSFRENDLF